MLQLLQDHLLLVAECLLANGPDLIVYVPSSFDQEVRAINGIPGNKAKAGQLGPDGMEAPRRLFQISPGPVSDGWIR